MKTGFSTPDAREPKLVLEAAVPSLSPSWEKLRKEVARQLAAPLRHEADAAGEASSFAHGFEIEFLKLLASESGGDSLTSLSDPGSGHQSGSIRVQTIARIGRTTSRGPPFR